MTGIMCQMIPPCALTTGEFKHRCVDDDASTLDVAWDAGTARTRERHQVSLTERPAKGEAFRSSTYDGATVLRER